MNRNIQFIAQTNIQLFHQLQEAGYNDRDLICIHQSYQLACRLFTGFFRGSGKPFLAHLVGTASILVSIESPIEIVAAGLLHATYELGDFGDGSQGVSSKKRNKIKQQVGKKIESYIARYTALKWNQSSAINIFNHLEKLDQTQKEVLLIRLANELEDYHDSGVLYCAKYQERLDYLNACSHLMVAMAQKLGYPNLAIALEQIFKESANQNILPFLQNTEIYSYVLNTSSPLQRLIGKWNYRLTNRLKIIFDNHDQESSALIDF
ncbi:HD domain-containing protein [Microcystis aeruginosa CS-563/04]|jgi:(p)ppGpp synthase/HD superfamily hydrolase|uniref:DUF6817 domain-containing protein n=1 Tax=Microcystis aeruginosa TaxID=1126 RepID=UPI002330EB72|nr:HD domain-containing protein [Microcystis aeruginosa]MDB9419185.1 HD domain-containing protein [Microcystis aeruginosa CS-563/04]